MKEKLITPNQLKSKEYQKLITEFPDAELPTQIPERCKTVYNLVGIRIKNTNTLSRSIQWKWFVFDVDTWVATKDEFKTASALGGYHYVMIIHNPTIKEKAKAKSKAAK